jgi:small GTP-binding protein
LCRDTAGQEDYDRLRPLSYPQSDVFLLCFSLISRTSLENAASKWAPELRAFDARNGTQTPIILLGTKSDLRNDPLNADGASAGMPVTHAEGLAASRRMGCDAYVECSAITQDGLKLAFDSAISIALRKKLTDREGDKKDRACTAGCSIM